jgi:hypothetical protein
MPEFILPAEADHCPHCGAELRDPPLCCPKMAHESICKVSPCFGYRAISKHYLAHFPEPAEASSYADRKRQMNRQRFPQLHPDAPFVADGKQPKEGVEYGCGDMDCTECYENIPTPETASDFSPVLPATLIMWPENGPPLLYEGNARHERGAWTMLTTRREGCPITYEPTVEILRELTTDSLDQEDR